MNIPLVFIFILRALFCIVALVHVAVDARGSVRGRLHLHPVDANVCLSHHDAAGVSVSEHQNHSTKILVPGRTS